HGARGWRRLRDEHGSAVAEFPMVAVLIIMIALMIVQAALIVHTRNTLVDAAVRERITRRWSVRRPRMGRREQSAWSGSVSAVPWVRKRPRCRPRTGSSA